MADTNPDILLLSKISSLLQKVTDRHDESTLFYMLIAYPDWKRQLDTCNTKDFTKTELELLSNINDLFRLLQTLVDMKAANRPDRTLYIVAATVFVITAIALIVRVMVL